MIKRSICLLLMLALSSCSFFQIRKPTIIQGNIITSEETSRLHTGMSSEEVMSVMGSPVLANVLSPNRMEYIYTYEDGTGKHEITRISCLFEGGRLRAIQKS